MSDESIPVWDRLAGWAADGRQAWRYAAGDGNWGVLPVLRGCITASPSRQGYSEKGWRTDAKGRWKIGNMTGI
jgi:hypothetical protein